METVKILNTWTSNDLLKNYYYEDNLVYENKGWKVYKQRKNSYLYTFKDIAVNNLGGLNKEHVDRLAAGKRPIGEYSSSHLIYDRAVTALAKGLSLL